jgi:hypothetical protein
MEVISDPMLAYDLEAFVMMLDSSGLGSSGRLTLFALQKRLRAKTEREHCAVCDAESCEGCQRGTKAA